MTDNLKLIQENNLRDRRVKNLRFQIAFTETNMRYLKSETPVDQEKLDFLRGERDKAEEELSRLVGSTNRD